MKSMVVFLEKNNYFSRDLCFINNSGGDSYFHGRLDFQCYGRLVVWPMIRSSRTRSCKTLTESPLAGKYHRRWVDHVASPSLQAFGASIFPSPDCSLLCQLIVHLWPHNVRHNKMLQDDFLGLKGESKVWNRPPRYRTLYRTLLLLEAFPSQCHEDAFSVIIGMILRRSRWTSFQSSISSSGFPI